MGNGEYVKIMVQSLDKKERVLDDIIKIDMRQREELENPSLDPDDFDRTFEEKAALIDKLEELDDGFQEVYEHIREEFQSNRESYRDEIAAMQGYIRRITEKSADIQAQEARNKSLMEQKFAAVRHQVREVRQSQKVVNEYYRNMMKSNFVEPQFTDKKK